MLDTFMARLRRHDASVGLALLELVRRADVDGALDRGEWLAAVRAAQPGGLAEAGEPLPGGAAGEVGAVGEPGRYLEDHILARLVDEGIATAEPSGEGWERVRVAPAVWADVGSRRDDVIAWLEGAVRNLLDGREQETVGDAGEPAATPAGSTLTARGLVKIYRKRKVVADVDIDVAQGEIVGLLGPNGAGKTTTFYMMVGLISPDAGEVYLDDEELTDVPMFKRARRGIGYLAQEPSIFRKLTVEQNIMAILETMGLSRTERKRRLEALLDELGIRHLRKARAYSLSGGERRRLEITRALVSRPKFMLLDEPFAGVDPIAVHDIQQIVADLRHRGIGVIITDHNVEQTLDIVDRAYIMYDGRVRVSGTVAELVWNEEVAEIYFGPTLTARMRERYRRAELVE
jgi:lipopolysaccharide export system ATP-binding protein